MSEANKHDELGVTEGNELEGGASIPRCHVVFNLISFNSQYNYNYLLADDH